MNLPLDGEISSHITSPSHTYLISVCSRVSLWDVFLLFPSCAEQAVRQTARTSADTEDGFSVNREHDGTMGGGFRTLRDRWVGILNEVQRLQWIGEVAVSLSGVCLCAFWTTLLYQLLWWTVIQQPQQKLHMSLIVRARVVHITHLCFRSIRGNFEVL